MTTPDNRPSTLSEEQSELLNKLADEYAADNSFRVGDRCHDAAIEECVYNAYLAGAKATLPTPQPEATISGWVARDKDKHLMLHQVCPQRALFVDGFPPEEGSIDLPQNLFPSLTWQDDPIEVEITIKPKKQ